MQRRRVDEKSHAYLGHGGHPFALMLTMNAFVSGIMVLRPPPSA